jgi:hypothetical protein
MNSLGDGSTLSLDFTTGVLDPRLTFSRASTATFVNSSGYVEYAGANLITYSNAFASGSWYVGGTPATLTPNYAVGPDGITGSAWRFQGALSNSVFAQPISNNGVAHVVSIYAKSNTGSNQTFGIYNGTSFVSLTATNVWQRFEVLVAGTWAYAYFGTIGASQDLLIWGAQSNLGSTAQTYYQTTTAAYHAPRFDYSPTNIGQPRGLLLESSAVNLATNSTFSSGWLGGSNVTTAFNTLDVLDPKGTNTATKCTLANSTFCSKFEAIVGLAASTTYTWSYWIRGTAGNTQRIYSLTAAADLVAQTAYTYSTSGWTRVTTTFTTTAAISTVYVYPINRNAGIGEVLYIWGAQLELGSANSSHIPTGASTVTRAADTAIIAAGTNFSSWYTGGTSGTFVANWYGSASSTTARTVVATSDQITKHLHMYQTPSALTLRLADYGAAATVTTGNNLTANALTKGAFSYASTATSLCLNGGTVATGTLAFTVAPTWLSIGGPSTNGTSITSTDVMLNNSIRTLKYFPARLSDAQIKEITT